MARLRETAQYLIILGDHVFGGLPEASDVDHLDVEVEVASDDVGVAGLVLLVRVQGSELEEKNK
jgi:hypothetical protein